MGNWRTVNIIGTCDSTEVYALKRAVDPGRDYDNFGPLSTGASVCGLNNWPAAKINAIGNLAERDYDVEQVAEHLRKLVLAAPSLNIKIHCGDEREAKNCVATITVVHGSVTVGKPEIETLDELSEGDLENNILNALASARRAW